jgi:hypothetical protein
MILRVIGFVPLPGSGPSEGQLTEGHGPPYSVERRGAAWLCDGGVCHTHRTLKGLCPVSVFRRPEEEGNLQPTSHQVEPSRA